MVLLDWWVYTLFGLIAGGILIAVGAAAGAKTETRRPKGLQNFMELVLDTLREPWRKASLQKVIDDLQAKLDAMKAGVKG